MTGGTPLNRRQMLARSATAAAALAFGSCGRKTEAKQPETLSPFKYRVSVGWLRDLASEATPNDKWPCIRWDDRLLEDQFRFLATERELGMTHNCAWGLFRDRDWPVPFENVIDIRRADYLQRFVHEAHNQRIKVMSGVGIFSWGFEEVIRRVPGVSEGADQTMCPQQQEAWDWMYRVLDFQMDPRWGLDGISMQSADQGRCQCEKCSKMSPAEHHALLLTRCAEYVRKGRPDWTIGQASWGLRVDHADEYPFVQEISRAVDYMVEVDELSAKAGRRPEIIAGLGCAFGSLGGVFMEPPQHWDRLRWFVPCGLGSARALAALRSDGGLACEYFYRPFVNPSEEVSWRTGAKILSAPETSPEDALEEAVEGVYGVSGDSRRALADWYRRGEEAYFSRIEFKPGDGDISLEPLIWKENPAAPGPPVYLNRIKTPQARADYAADLRSLKAEMGSMQFRDSEAAWRTMRCIDGTLADLASLD